MSMGLSSGDGLRGVQRDAGHLGHKNELVGLQGDGHAGGHLFHAEIEGLARGREPERRQQHQRAHVQRLGDAPHIHLANQAAVLEIHPVHDAHRPCRDEVARQHPHRAARHGGVGQALAERSFNFIAQLAGGLLGTVQRHRIGDADAVRVARLVPLGRQLFVHLRAKTVHQHHLHAHALDHGQVLRQVVQLACGNGFSGHAHHKGLVAELVDVGCHRPEPGHEGEVEDVGHLRQKG